MNPKKVITSFGLIFFVIGISSIYASASGLALSIVPCGSMYCYESGTTTITSATFSTPIQTGTISYSVTFVLQSSSGTPISNGQITISTGTVGYTNSSGETTFKNLLPNSPSSNYTYTITGNYLDNVSSTCKISLSYHSTGSFEIYTSNLRITLPIKTSGYSCSSTASVQTTTASTTYPSYSVSVVGYSLVAIFGGFFLVIGIGMIAIGVRDKGGS